MKTSGVKTAAAHPSTRQLGRASFRHNLIGNTAFWIFHWRLPLLVLFVAITAVLGYSASRLRIEAGFSKMIPLTHAYMSTFTEYSKVYGGANQVLVALHGKQGGALTAPALSTLQTLHEEVFFIPGVERSSVTSLWSPNVRYQEVVEDGFSGGPIISTDFDGSEQSIVEVRNRILKSAWVGRIVSNDLQATLVRANLLEVDPETGHRLDVQAIARRLEALRQKYEDEHFDVHIIGFAKSIGDIADGAGSVVAFFGVAFVITAVLLFWYSGSLMLTSWALVCAIVPVVWLLGLLPLLGLALDPLSILVPFLIFSIGVSHAVQMTNAWKLETLHGADGVVASRNAFLKLFVPGAMALLANALGFLVIAFVQIEIVQELAFMATIGVSVMIVTNKMLLPILLSYMKLSPREARKLRGKETAADLWWERISPLATPKVGAVAIVVALGLLGVGYWQARDLQIGDLGKGVPELRPQARYNQDVDYITGHFAIGVDRLSVIVESKGIDSPCTNPEVMDRIDRFEHAMRQIDGVQSVMGMAGFAKAVNASYSEGNIKWRALPDDKAQLAQAVAGAGRGSTELVGANCNAMQITLFTADHQAATLDRIVAEVKRLQRELESSDPAAPLQFRLASGNAGVMAATNEVMREADRWVNAALFGSVTLLCLLAFRSLRITLCIILPLALVTLLCNAVMAALGIGVKVNTLPVVALGVGVGVDYGIYLFESMKHAIEERQYSLQQAFLEGLKERGTASVFTAVTMTIGVATWIFSALKFQADMGVLLVFMFMVNLFGAVLLLPALAAFIVRDRLAGKVGEPTCDGRSVPLPSA